MSKKTIKMIAGKQLKWYKTEIILLWLLIAIGAILTLTGAGVYFYVDKLIVVQYVSSIPTHTFVVPQVKMLSDFAKVLGIVISLVGVVL